MKLNDVFLNHLTEVIIFQKIDWTLRFEYQGVNKSKRVIKISLLTTFISISSAKQRTTVTESKGAPWSLDHRMQVPSSWRKMCRQHAHFSLKWKNTECSSGTWLLEHWGTNIAVALILFKKSTLFLAMPWGMWDLSSLTRDQTCTPCVGNAQP